MPPALPAELVLRALRVYIEQLPPPSFLPEAAELFVVHGRTGAYVIVGLHESFSLNDLLVLDIGMAVAIRGVRNDGREMLGFVAGCVTTTVDPSKVWPGMNVIRRDSAEHGAVDFFALRPFFYSGESTIRRDREGRGVDVLNAFLELTYATTALRFTSGERLQDELTKSDSASVLATADWIRSTTGEAADVFLPYEWRGGKTVVAPGSLFMQADIGNRRPMDATVVAIPSSPK
jgi:hypothetical protein